MLDAMVQRGFAQRTLETYIGATRRMAHHYRRDPAQYTPQQVQAYLLHMVKQELQFSGALFSGRYGKQPMREFRR